MTALEQDRATLRNLARWSGEMDIPERHAVHLAQKHEARLDSILELHAPAPTGVCVECRHAFPCPTVIRAGVDQ